jgi:hypothetical protein
MRRISFVATALALAVTLAPAAGAWAQTQTVNGRIEHIEPGSRTLYFSDGRIVTLAPGATLWVDGREVPIETLRRGMNVVVQTGAAGTMTQAPSASGTMQGHPPVTASGTVARVDSERGIVTFQDGRTLRVSRGSQVWEASNLDDIRPGEQALLSNAYPTGYAAASNVPSDRVRMGRVIKVDPARSMVLLEDGTWIGVAPTTRMRMNGREGRTQVQPGDELIVVIAETQPRPARQRPPVAGGAGAPSALSREALVERWDALQADEVHIIRRPQAP